MGNNNNNIGNELNTKNTNRGALGILIGAIVVIFAAAFYMAWPGMTPTEDTGKTPPRKPIQLTDQQQQERVAEIVASDDLSKCESIKGVVIGEVDYYKVCRGNIIRTAALQSLSTAECAKLSDTLFKVSECERIVIMKKLERDQNVSVCEEAKEGATKALCESTYWLEQALIKKDVAVCNQIGVTSHQEGCRHQFWVQMMGDNSAKVNCAEIPSTLTADCEIWLNMSRRNIWDNCLTLGDSKLQIWCEEKLRTD